MTGILEGLAISAAASLLSAGITYALTPTQKIEQGRQDSLLPGTVGYGRPIPWAWGTVRLPGQRIWQTALEEVKKKTKQGKGAKVETTDYTYYGYYAELFCECPFRPIEEFSRIWMNKKLTYSKHGGAETIAAGGKFADRYLRFYRGLPSQNIDPLLANAEAIQNYSYGLPQDPNERNAYLRSLGVDLNVDLTSAHNYHAYMVAQRLPLGDFFNAIPGGEAEIKASSNCTVEQIVGDILSLFYSRDRFDVSLLDMPVRGFSVDSPTAASSTIQTLQQAYFFDVVNSGNVVKFVPLNHPRDIINLSATDLAAHQSGTEKPLDYEVIEADPNSLPSKVIVNHIDPDNDYDSGQQYSSGQVRSYYNYKPVTLSFNLVMTSSEAATLADRAFYLAWSKKYLYKFQLPPAYLDLEPTDLIPDLFSDGVLPIKITQTRIGANLILDCEGEQHENFFFDFARFLESGGITTGIADYNVVLEVDGTPVSVADENGQTYVQGTDYLINEGNIQILESGAIAPGTNLVVSTTKTPTAAVQEIKEAGDTTLLVLDIPLINDSDPDYSLYLVASGGVDWNGATVFYSIDNSRYIEAAKILTYGIHGVSTDILGSSDRLSVFVNAQELETITHSDLALGLNYALLGNEIIQFKTAELIDYNTYQLSDIVRGLRGTEHEIDNHAVGDRFVLLTGENAAVTKITATSSDINETRYFKAVSTGQVLDEVEPIQITYQAVSMRPYSPTNITATKNTYGDIAIAWSKRYRREQKNSSQTDNEEFQVEIINSNGATIRTKQENNSSSIYTAAEQEQDFGAIQTTIALTVATGDSVYGFGIPQSATLTPNLIEPVPLIAEFEPASGIPGTTINVTGDNLATISSIRVGDVEQLSLGVADNQNVSFDLAYGSVSGKIAITTDGGTVVSNSPLIVEALPPNQKPNFPAPQTVTLPYTIQPTDDGTEIIILGETGLIFIPNDVTDPDGIYFEATWGCEVTLEGVGEITIVKEDSTTTGIKGDNVIAADNQTVRLWHRGNNIWKIS